MAWHEMAKEKKRLELKLNYKKKKGYRRESDTVKKLKLNRTDLR